ncbi:hypothetical protein GOP47_0007948 [Adiantum capillus-veneris]|nr:hypothetical protein GOP47_0007948 [Adiantum capillus-veneris]
MALSSSLLSGQSYYTVESLEGASALPPLKPSFAAADREFLLRLDAHKRALAAERESLDAEKRLLAADREALVRSDPRLADLLPPVPGVDARTRLDGLPAVDASRRLLVDELHALDSRSRLHGLDVRPNDDVLDSRFRIHGLDVRSHDPLWQGLDDRARSLGSSGGLAFGAQVQRSLPEVTRTRELSAGARSGAASFLSSENYLHGRRDIADGRTSAMPMEFSRSRRDIVSRPSTSSFKPLSERPFHYGKQERAALRPPVEAARKQDKSVTSVKTPPAYSKTKPPAEKGDANKKAPPVKALIKPPPEQSEGWCALCKIDCHNIKTLNHHLGGRRHKAMAEGKSAKSSETSADGKADGKPNPAANKQADRKRASDAKPETSQNAKRQKTSTVAVANGAPTNTPDKKEKANKMPVVKGGKDNPLACEVCNISVTGQKNLEFHLKGKRHAARLKELATNS